MPRYLLVTHVPFGRCAQPGCLMTGDLWLEDLRAQASAIADQGMTLRVATPLVDNLTPSAGGSFNNVAIRPEEQGFEYHPLPFYNSLKGYVQVRAALKDKLRRAMRDVDVVHAGYGGHPIGVGAVAWPIARELGRKRIWIFDGADPFPRMQLHAEHETNPIKRWAKLRYARRFESFCRGAIRDADLVFSHNAAVAERFRDIWNGHCHVFDRSFVTEANLISETELAQRQARLMSDSPLKLLVASRQIAIKGTDHVLWALAEAREKGAKIELEIYGDGEDLPRFMTLASELKLDDFVRFHGVLPYGRPLFDAWSGAHVMVITNLTAEISRNVLLAMARGLPLIMYRNPGTDELIEQHAAGILTPMGDIPALAQAMVEAESNRDRLAQIARRGLDLARTKTLDACHRERAKLARGLLEEAVTV